MYDKVKEYAAMDGMLLDLNLLNAGGLDLTLLQN
jgi:hypothetical protein